jgi:hypothetical protein
MFIEVGTVPDIRDRRQGHLHSGKHVRGHPRTCSHGWRVHDRVAGVIEEHGILYPVSRLTRWA